MAGNAVIGSLRVVLGADTAQLDKGLKDAQSSLSRFAGQMKNVGLVAAGALAGALGGAAVAIKSALTEADNLGKLAQSVGLPVEELSKLKYAAQLSDISLESLGTSLVKLSKNMSEVAGGNATGAAAMAFKTLGISVRDASGNMKSADTIMSEVADRFVTYKDGANKTALAVALFGRAGAAMIPLLNQGSAALQEAKQEAEQLGLVIDSKTASAAENFNDNLTRLGKVMSGVWTQVAARLAPSFAQLSAEFVTAAKNAETLRYVSSGLEVATKALASAVLVGIYAYKQFATVIGTVIAAAIKISGMDFAGALEILKGGLTEVKTTALETVDSFQRLWSPPDQGGWLAAIGASNAALKEAIGIGERYLELQKRDAPALPQGGDNALQSYLAGIEKRKVAMQAEIATIGMSEAAQERLKIQYEGLEIARQKNIALTPQVIAGINATAESYGALSQRLQESRQNWQFVEGSISTVASGLTDVLMRSKTAAEAFREMALSIIRDFTQMIIKAQLMRLATAFMGSIGGGASFGGAGFANGIPQGVGLGGYAGSFATGGSFKVPSVGSTGIDSQLMSMHVTPGERVSVTKDGGYPGDAGGVVINQSFDFTNANRDSEARLRSMAAKIKADAVQESIRQVAKVRSNNPRYMAGG